MHFWVGGRAAQYHHNNRRQRAALYSGTFFGTGIPNPNRRDKASFESFGSFGSQWNRRFSTAHINQSRSQNQNQNQQPSSSNITSNNIPSSSTGMVTPIHRFQTIGPLSGANPEQISTRFSVTGNGNPGNGAADFSPSARQHQLRDLNSSGYYNPRYHCSRSQERQDRRCDNEERHRRRRSSSSRRYRNSASLASTEIGAASAANSELRESSLSSSDADQPDCTRTKRIGLTLCFMGFILLCTVAAKFVIEGPGIIDTSRRGQTETTAYFFLTELIFVAFAMALFFTGVACLRKRTNDYLFRQFNQHILSRSGQRVIPDDLSNSELLYDPIIITAGDGAEHSTERNSIRASYPHPAHGLSAITTPIHHSCLCRHSPSHHSSSSYTHHHHHHAHLSGYGPSEISSQSYGHLSRHGHRYLSSGGSNRRCPYTSSSATSAAILLQKQQPPPYHIALHLPLPSDPKTTSPTPMTPTVTVAIAGAGAPDQYEIITTDEQRRQMQIIGTENCNVNPKEDSVREDETILANATATNKEERPRENVEQDAPPETPPPSYEQFSFQL